MSNGDKVTSIMKTGRSDCCPICQRPVVAGLAPFCSRRCADVDLARWLGGVYRIETDEGPANTNSPQGDDRY